VDPSEGRLCRDRVNNANQDSQHQYSWLVHTSPYSRKNIIDTMTEEEKNSLKEAAEMMMKEGLPEDVQPK
jgi:hypothetical protein